MVTTVCLHVETVPLEDPVIKLPDTVQVDANIHVNHHFVKVLIVMNELLFLKNDILRHNIATTPVLLSAHFIFLFAFLVCEDDYFSNSWGCWFSSYKGNHSEQVVTSYYLFVYTILRYTFKNR